MRVLISAAESSSDIHGAQLLAALKKQEPQIEAFGIGGPKLQAEGLRAVVDARELLAMGFIEVLGQLPRIFRAMRKVTSAALATPPALAVLIDYPDFHFRLARRLRKQGVPLVYYIPPKVWVWRKKRVLFLKEAFVKLLCIFPFEESFYRAEQVDAKYVGNPLLDELPLKLTREQARIQLGYGEREPVLVLMPGSRKAEIDQHLLIFLDAAEAAAQELLSQGAWGVGAVLKAVLPLPTTSDFKQIQARVAEWQAQITRSSCMEVVVTQGNAAECLAAADAGLIKSGTSTLEAALMRCPHAVIYKPSKTTAWIFKYLIRYKGPVGLVNLAGGWSVGDPYLVPEILCEKVTVTALKQQILDLFQKPLVRNGMLEGFEKLRQKMIQPESPSLCAAREILALLNRPGQQSTDTVPSRIPSTPEHRSME